MRRFFQSKESPKTKPLRPVSILQDRVPFLPLMEQHGSHISYMADMASLNQANPHVIHGTFYTGTEKLTGTAKRPVPTSNEYLLRASEPRKRVGLKEDGSFKKDRHIGEIKLESACTTDGEIPHGEWLRKRYSVTSWENDSNAKMLPRIAIAMLLEDDDFKVDLVNTFIRSIGPYSMKDRALSRTGTRRPFAWARDVVDGSNFELEYDDFTICTWTRLLFQALNDPKMRLMPETKSHILTELLKFEGPDYVDAIPNTGPFKHIAEQMGYPITDTGIRNSENHLLMINGSAYLKNQVLNPEINSGSNLERKLCEHLDHLYENGLEEFNSIPYAGYTIEALLNLHDFANEPVKGRATRVLDKIFYDYIIHSTDDGKSFRPFGRQMKKVSNQHFTADDSVRPFLMAWLGMDLSYYRQSKNTRNAPYVLSALLSSYRLPRCLYELATKKDGSYLAFTGHEFGEPEISYKNNYQHRLSQSEPDLAQTKQYLLTGGGVNEELNLSSNYFSSTTVSKWINPAAADYACIQKKRYIGEVVTRNPTLIIDGSEGPFTLADAFYLGTEHAIQPRAGERDGEFGPGIDSKGKNNCGIYFDTMVGPYPVHVPEKYRSQGIKPEVAGDIASMWTLYEVDDGLKVAVFDGNFPRIKKDGTSELKKLGIVLVIPEPTLDSQMLINEIARQNSATAEERPESHIGNTIHFPGNCNSVVANHTIRFNAYSALDRYPITGCDGVEFPLTSRIFCHMALRDGSGDKAPGWSAASAIQTSPEAEPVCLLDPESKDYAFMQAQSASLTTKHGP